MASFRLQLHKPHKATSPIVLSISDRNIRLRYFPGVSITTKYWDQNKQKLKHQSIEAVHVNPELDNIVVAAKEVVRKYIAEGRTLTKDALKGRLDEVIKGKGIEEGQSFFAFVDEHIKTLPTKINPKTGSLISPNTVKIHNQLRARLKEFKEATGTRVEFDEIDLNFYYKFVDWVYGVTLKNGEPKYSLNTLGKYINTLKTWLGLATAQGLNTNMDFRKAEFKRPKERSVEVYLNEGELKKLRELDLSKQRHLEVIRDLFLVACYCGLRYSDFSRLTSKHIFGNVIKIRAQKTGEIVETPISKPVRDVINKYNGTFPKAVKNQPFNLALKEIGQLAEIDDPVVIHRTRGGKREELTKSKYEMIKTHTARRSFATNMYNANIPVNDIMNITGHKSESEFFNYIRTEKSESVGRVMEKIDSLFT